MRILNHSLKRILHPLNLSLPIYAYNIKSTGSLPVMCLQIILRGKLQAPLFFVVYAGQRAAKMLLAAQPHFDKNQRIRILHNQVDLAASAAVIGVDMFQPTAH